MSSPKNHEQSEMLPPPKRQRTLPGGNLASQRSTQSRSVSAPYSHKIKDSSSALSPLRAVNCHSNDDGSIFTNVQEIDGGSSIEAALGVPSRILFRQVGGDCKENVGGKDNKSLNRRRLRPLLSRQEAEQFLRVTLLAQEIDVLVDLSETVLEKRQFARRFRRDVLVQGSKASTRDKDRTWKNPWLTTLGPVLDVLEQRKAHPSNQNQIMSNPQHNSPGDILHYIHNELTRLYHALQTCGIYELERSAEQNRSLVASLTDILGYALDTDGQADGRENGRTSAVRNLAREKESLAKLQDLLAKRVRSLLVVLCHSNTVSTTESSDASDDGDKMGAQVDSGIHNQQILFDEQLSSPSRDGDTDNHKTPTDNDDSSILSLEEILKPLEVVCDELFDQPDNDTTATTASKQTENENDNDHEKSSEVEKAPKDNQQNVHEDTSSGSLLLNPAASASNTTNGEFVLRESMEEDPNPMEIVPLEMSQRTVGAAATILSLASDPKQDIVDTYENTTTQNNTFSEKNLNHSNKGITGEPEASQRAVGAANTMMALATKTGLANKPNEVPKNGNSRTFSNSTTNRSDPQTPPHRGDDDDSYIEDPPSDGEMGNNESIKKHEATSNGRVGIFDVVDVLTPASQS